MGCNTPVSSLHALLMNSIGLQNSYMLVKFCLNRQPSENISAAIKTHSNISTFTSLPPWLFRLYYMTWSHARAHKGELYCNTWKGGINRCPNLFSTALHKPPSKAKRLHAWSAEHTDALTSLADGDYTWCSCHHCGWSTEWARHPSGLCSGLKLHPQLQIAQHPAPTFEEDFRNLIVYSEGYRNMQIWVEQNQLVWRELYRLEVQYRIAATSCEQYSFWSLQT